MNGIQQDELETLLRRESRAKRYMLLSFMFGVFFLATLKDLLSAGFQSAAVIIRLALMIGFILMTIYFYLEANGILDDEEKDKLDDHREFLEKNQEQEEEKQSFVDKYFTSADLKAFKKTVYMLWVIIFVIFMGLAVLSLGPAPTTEEETNGTTNTTTTTTGTTPVMTR